MVGSLFLPLIIPKNNNNNNNNNGDKLLYHHLIRWLFIGFILGIDCGNSMK